MASTCVICLEDVVVSVKCPSCSVESHAKCIETHLLSSMLDPHCPSCSKEWDYCFLAENLQKSWRLGPYKLHREAILLDREKSLLPETQDDVVRIINECKLGRLIETRKLELNHERARLATLKAQRGILLAAAGKKTTPELVIVREEIKQQTENVAGALTVYTRTRGGHVRVETGEVIEKSADIPPSRREFIHPCPAPDCRGFLSTGWKCKLCSAKCCAKCGNLLPGEDHVCNPDTLASFSEVLRNSKPCPKCGAPISKISGCDHMFCVSCKTAFSWKTGEIHPGGNSNPYYWQWVAARGPLPPVQQGCDPRQRIYRIVQGLLARLREDLPPVIFESLTHGITHLLYFDIPYYRNNRDNNDHRNLRIKYLMKDITEDRWRMEIQKAEKKQRKARFIVNIGELFVNASLDILEPLTTAVQVLEHLPEIEELRAMCNRELSKIPVIFSSTDYRISETYTLQRVQDLKK